MIEQEEAQATMARSLLQIYTMLEQQKEVVGGSDDSNHERPHYHAQSPDTGNEKQRKSLLSSDLGPLRKPHSRLGGSAIGVRGEVLSPTSSPKRPGHRRQGSVGGQEILKIKPEVEIEQGEEGKEQKNMEQIIKLSAERLRILERYSLCALQGDMVMLADINSLQVKGRNQGTLHDHKSSLPSHGAFRVNESAPVSERHTESCHQSRITTTFTIHTTALTFEPTFAIRITSSDVALKDRNPHLRKSNNR